MTGPLFIILFGFNFVTSPCQGIITLPPRGDIFVVDPGTARVEIAWTFNDAIDVATVRQWKFLSTDEVLAIIVGNGNVVYRNTSLPDYEVIKPATLVLKNVDDRYNGTYEFSINTVTPKSSVTVFIAVTPTISVNSSALVAVDEGHVALYIQCKGAGGNPPAEVTWLKDNNQKVSGPGYETETLVLEDIDKNDNGTYTCVAESAPEVKNETSIDVIVSYKPGKPEILVKQNRPGVILTCLADAFPPPTYFFFFNGSVVSSKQEYVIPEVNSSNAGLYYCRAENRLGGENSSTSNVSHDTAIKSTEASTTITASPPTSTPTSTTSAGNGDKTGSPGGGGGGSGSSGLGTGAIVGIVIGSLIVLLVIMIFLWWRKNKQKAGYGGNANVNPSNSDNAPLGGRGDNLYDSVNDGAKATKDKAGESTSGNPPGHANQPVVYATVDKNKKNELAVTYATLDTMAMQPNGSRKRDNEPTREQTEYASIQFKDLKADLV